jgi:hypothetical protein
VGIPEQPLDIPEQSTGGGTAARWGNRAAGLAGACHPGPVVTVTALMSALAVVAGQGTARWLLAPPPS